MMSENPTPLAPDREADDRLVHALLAHVHDTDGVANREARIGQVLREIDRKALMRTGRVARRWWLVAAALLLVVFSIVGLFNLSTPARASLTDILGALGKPGDRTYRLSVVPSDAGTQSRHGLDGATLYLRDGHQYVLQRIGPKGADLYDGYDGRESWRVRAGQLAESQSGPGAGGVPVPQALLEMSVVDLQQTVSGLQKNYTISSVDDELLGGILYRHLLARRQDNARGPATVEIWADRVTGLPHRIVFDRAKFQGNSEPRRLTFDLSGEASLPADWFSPMGHTGH